ncbi:MAG: DUF3570 domain-containing protein [Polyangiales bacterium]
MRWRWRWWCVAGWSAWAAWFSSAAVQAEDTLTAGTFVRTDSDGTEVVSPNAAARFRMIDNYTYAELGYSADVWSSASVDIRTAATGRVSEQRHELRLGLAREYADWVLRGDYRFSHEHDYVAHGGGIGIEHDFAEGNSTLGARFSLAHDTVGRAGDERFSRGLTTAGLHVVFSQVLDPETILQVAYEGVRREGYQASPYRFVGIGGDGDCGGSAVLCVPEAHPSVRFRHAAVGRVRRALHEAWSLGGDYRFYADDWGLRAHTFMLTLNWLPDDDVTLSLQLRSHVQGAADFYRSRYLDAAQGPSWVSRDRELSSMHTQRAALLYTHSLELSTAGPPVLLTLSPGLTWLHYNAFVGLDEVVAFDMLLSAWVEL